MSTSRIQPDSRPVLIVATVITALLAAVSFLLSFNGLAEAASWANVPGWLAWALPAYVDGAILVYTVAALVFRSRGDDARLEWAALGLFAALSVAANGVHAWTTAPEWLQVALGVTLAALAPVSVLLTTHTIAKLIVAPPGAAEEADPVLAEDIVPAGLIAYAEADVEATREVWPILREKVLELPADDLPEVEPDHLPPTPAALLQEANAEGEPVDPIALRNARIRELAAEGDSLRTIAAKVGCSKSNVARVLGKRPDADEVEDAA
ncbi:membrane protein [Microbacterium phage Gretchen]|nr:membrane protein [Microbacterium phage Gretchen]